MIKKTNTKIWKDSMKEIILLEISNYCAICPIHDKCVEDDCVLFRIEIIVLNSIKKKERKVGNKNDKHSNISR